MSTEPTSTLTFGDLIVEVARKIGFAYYGADGTEVAQEPVDAHDLDECKRHVNNGVRMFLADAPANGWRFARPVASVMIWNDQSGDEDNTVTGGSHDDTADKTTLTAESDSFYESMEGHSIVIEGVGTFTITNYLSATQIKVSGDASSVDEDTWSIAANGNYTLPRTFAGEHDGSITYAADTNEGISLEWTDEGTIRQWRENVTDETGDPYWAAVRPMSVIFDGRRRWELVTYPSPDEVLEVLFPYTLHFDKLVDTDEVLPVPFSHDETVKAACLAVVDKDVDGAPGVDWQYYRQTALPNSHRIDGRSGPRRLGKFSNPSAPSSGNIIQQFRQYLYDRPVVTYDSD